MTVKGSFEPRALANMTAALGGVCKQTPTGERHSVRKRVAKAIVQCARRGEVSLGALTLAGAKAIERLREKGRPPH
jgi:hypothetical protein